MNVLWEVTEENKRWKPCIYLRNIFYLNVFSFHRWRRVSTDFAQQNIVYLRCRNLFCFVFKDLNCFLNYLKDPLLIQNGSKDDWNVIDWGELFQDIFLKLVRCFRILFYQIPLVHHNNHSLTLTFR